MQEFIDPFLDISHFSFDEIGSTNDEAFNLSQDREVDCFFVIAKKQSNGRGRRGRQWVSEKGNLYCSAFLKKPASAEKCSQLSFVTVVALGWALCELEPSSITHFHYKWPNDLLWNGAKLAGLLLEARPHEKGLNVVVGLGVNCKSFPEKTPYTATSLVQEEVNIDAERLFQTFKRAFIEALKIWNKGHNFNFFRDEWLKKAAGLGKEIIVRLDNEEIIGIFKTIDKEGRLILKLFDGTIRKISAGDVFFPAIKG